MKALVVCRSVHNKNTWEIAETMAEELDALLKRPDEVDLNEVKEYDLIGFGSGIYFKKHHKEIFSLVDELPNMDGKAAFIFSTSGMPKLPYLHDFEAPLRNKLEEKGFDIIGSFDCRGYDDYGPFKYIGGVHSGRPNEEDLEGARKFAKNILSKFENFGDEDR